AELLALLCPGQTRLLYVIDESTRVHDVRRADELRIRDVHAWRNGQLALVDRREPVPDVAVCGTQRRITIHGVTEIALPADLACDEGRITQACELTAVRLETVLDREQLLAHLLFHLRVRLGQ